MNNGLSLLVIFATSMTSRTAPEARWRCWSERVHQRHLKKLSKFRFNLSLVKDKKPALW
jgi:hypothetical protein